MTKERVEQFLKSVKPEKTYNDFLKNKRIAIVGPSKHVLLEKNGTKIDDYDIVVRLKWLPMKGFNIYKDFVGDETHAMYSSVVNHKSEYEVLQHSGIQHTRHPQCSVGAALESKVHHGIVATSYSSEEYAFILKDYATANGYKQDKVANINSKSPYAVWPQLGFNAIMESIASDAKEVYITGFTMYHGGGHMLQKNKPAHHNKTIVDKHNGVLEVLMLRDVIEYSETKEKKIILDSVLNKILNEYKGVSEEVELLASVMDNLTNQINNLVKDL